MMKCRLFTRQSHVTGAKSKVGRGNLIGKNHFEHVKKLLGS